MTHVELGQLGENMAVKLLKKKKYKILDRNYRFGRNEIDIVAKQSGELVIVEVKCRETGIIGEPYEAVTRSKQRQIISVANHYVQENDMDVEVRFDIVSIIHNSHRTKLEHIEDAFFPTR